MFLWFSVIKNQNNTGNVKLKNQKTGLFEVGRKTELEICTGDHAKVHVQGAI